MKKVLIIDDDQFILKVYQKKFETEGLVVEVAADGPASLDTLRRSVPALILLDLMLPGMSGVELLGHIRTLPAAPRSPSSSSRTASTRSSSTPPAPPARSSASTRTASAPTASSRSSAQP